MTSVERDIISGSLQHDALDITSPDIIDEFWVLNSTYIHILYTYMYVYSTKVR